MTKAVGEEREVEPCGQALASQTFLVAPFLRILRAKNRDVKKNLKASGLAVPDREGAIVLFGVLVAWHRPGEA